MIWLEIEIFELIMKLLKLFVMLFSIQTFLHIIVVDRYNIIECLKWKVFNKQELFPFINHLCILFYGLLLVFSENFIWHFLNVLIIQILTYSDRSKFWLIKKEENLDLGSIICSLVGIFFLMLEFMK